MRPGTDFTALKKRLESDRRLTVDVSREKEFYRHQSAATSTFFNILGMVISIIFSLGAIVGAMITMYASVANRTIEIGTLRALGFSRLSILSAFLIESLVIAVVSGLVGIAAAQVLQTVNVSTTNWDTFTELAFNFRMSPSIALRAMIFSIVMGLLGGFLPAVRAARLRIINALRTR
ncbi:MAG: ABC transporter permease [Candidatus Zixiibacteriota bacterium]|nr:MAG: ABC transporter permease [candidate division Zixibacteria bacterium]